MISVTVEGMLFLPHSYAVVNQYQCLELLKRPEIRLYHRMMGLQGRPYQPMPGLLEETSEALLRAIPPPGDRPSDVTLRMTTPPYDLSPSGSRRTLVFGTVELGYLNTHQFPEGRIPEGLLERNSVEIVTPSRWSRDGFVRSGAPPGRVHIVPHGVDPSTFRPLPDEERRRGREQLRCADDFVFLHIGAMTRSKGIEPLLKAFAAVARVRPRVRLLLKGSDALYKSAQKLAQIVAGLDAAEQKLLATRVVYRGDALSAANTARLYQLADTYAAPYLGEGFNLPVLEAAACGLPVICTSGGPTDDFTSSGFSLPINSTIRHDPASREMRLEPDPHHLTELMIRAVDDTAWVQAARAAGPAYVHGNFTWKHAVDRLVNLLAPAA